MKGSKALFHASHADQHKHPVRRVPQLMQNAGHFILPGNPFAGIIDNFGEVSAMYNRTPGGMEIQPGNPNVTSGGGSIPWQNQYVNGGVSPEPGMMPATPYDPGTFYGDASRAGASGAAAAAGDVFAQSCNCGPSPADMGNPFSGFAGTAPGDTVSPDVPDWSMGGPTAPAGSAGGNPGPGGGYNDPYLGSTPAVPPPPPNIV